MSEDRHARPSSDALEPLYDVDIPTPTHAERARTLVAQISTGTLCTLAIEPEGYPYGSFVTVAFENENPIFLISELAEHTKNLERDPRANQELLCRPSACACLRLMLWAVRPTRRRSFACCSRTTWMCWRFRS